MSGNRHPKGYVYFFHSPVTGQTKIGRSRYPGNRFDEISRHVPQLDCIATIGTEEPAELEKAFHRAFAFKREQGEWFALTAEDRAIIATAPDHADHVTDLPPALFLLWSMSSVRDPKSREQGYTTFHVTPRMAALLAALESLTIQIEGGRGRDPEQVVGEAIDAVLLAEVEKRIGAVEPEIQAVIRDAIAGTSHAPVPAEESEVEEAA